MVIDQTWSQTVSALESPEHACNNLWAAQQPEGDVQAGLHFKDICLLLLALSSLPPLQQIGQFQVNMTAE